MAVVPRKTNTQINTFSESSALHAGEIRSSETANRRDFITLTQEIPEEGPKLQQRSVLFKAWDFLRMSFGLGKRYFSFHAPSRTWTICIGLLVLLSIYTIRRNATLAGQLNVLREDFNALLSKQNELNESLKSALLEKEKASHLLPNSSVPAPSPAISTGLEEAISARSLLLDGSEKDDPFLGSANAPFVLMLFTDYESKLCRGFHTPVIEKLKAEYADSGKVKILLRDFPLRSNLHAKAAANFAQCAGEQGAYWDAFQLLNEKADLVSNGDFRGLAVELKNVDFRRLGHCLTQNRYEGEITKDQANAVSLGAKGAPDVFIGPNRKSGSVQGVLIRGAQPYPVIKEQIEKLLNTLQN